MGNLSDRRNSIRQRVADSTVERTAGTYQPSITRSDVTSQQEGFTSSLSKRRNKIKTDMNPTPAKVEYTPQEQVDNSTANYQTRLDFEQQPYEEKKSFLGSIGSGLLKVLDYLDRPRNAAWVAAKGGVEKTKEDIKQGKPLISINDKPDLTYLANLFKGITREENYSGSDLTNDVFGERKEDASTGEKVGRFAFSVGSEVLLDPLNLVTLGGGKAAKGFLTGTGATLSDDAIEGIAKAATSTLTPDNLNRVAKTALQNPDAYVTAGKMSAQHADALKKVAEITQDVYDFDNILAAVKKGGKSADSILSKGFSSTEDLKNAFLQAEDALNTTVRNEVRETIGNYAGKYGIDADTITHFTDSLKTTYNMDAAQDFVKPLTDYIKNRVLGYAEDAIAKNPKLGGKGFSIAGNTFKTGAELQDIGANASKFIREYGLNNDGVRAVLARKYSGFQDAVGTVFSKYFTKGVDAETNKVFKALINSGEYAKNLADEDLAAKALGFRNQITDLVKSNYKDLSGGEKVKKIEAIEKSISDFIELGSSPEIITRLQTEYGDEITDAIGLISKNIKTDLANMGIAEAQIGKLNSIMDGYLPHVRNTDLAKMTKKEIRDLNLARAGQEDTFVEATARQTGNSGSVVGKDFTTSSKAARKRMYSGTIDEANLMKKLNTSSKTAASNFARKLRDTDDILFKDLVKNGYLKIYDNVPHFNTVVEDPEFFREMMNRIPKQLFDELDGVSNYFETSAVKAYLVRAIQHNRVVAQNKTARDILFAMGQPIGRKDYDAMRDMVAKGYDIVITKGYFENVSLDQLRQIAELSEEKANFIQKMLRASSSGNDVMRGLSSAEIDQFADLMQTTKIPVELFAVPKAVRETYNKIAQSQIDDGFNTIGKTIDSLHRIWKPLVTGYRPDFHARNYISSNMNDLMDTGFKVLDPRYKIKGSKVGANSKAIIEVGGEKFTGDEIYRMMQGTGSLSNMTRDLSQGTLDETLKQFKSSGRSKIAKVVGAYEKGGHAVGNAIEGNLRATNFLINLERGLDNGMAIQRAAQYAGEKVKQYHFDYADLSNVERKLLRRIMPFYTWARKNIPLQLENFLDNPALYNRINNVVTGLAEENNVDLNNLPTWAQDTLPLFTGAETSDGRDVAVTGLFPQSDLSSVFQSPTDNITENLSGMSPLFKAPLELALNKSILTGAPIYRTEAEKKNAILKYLLGSTGFLRDATNTLTKQGAPNGEMSAAYNLPFGVGNSLVKGYNEDKATYNRSQEYLRYLADVIQGLNNTGNDVATISEIKDYEDAFEQPTTGATSLSERRRRLKGEK